MAKTNAKYLPFEVGKSEKDKISRVVDQLGTNEIFGVKEF